jgi:hypothetical protein
LYRAESAARYKASLLQSHVFKHGFLLPSAFVLLPSEGLDTEIHQATNRTSCAAVSGVVQITNYHEFLATCTDRFNSITR